MVSMVKPAIPPFSINLRLFIEVIFDIEGHQGTKF